MKITANDISADELVARGTSSYHGFSLRETAGAAAVVRIYDGLTATGVLLDTISFLANESKQAYYSDGVRVKLGIYVDVVSGAVEGSVRAG